MSILLNAKVLNNSYGNKTNRANLFVVKNQSSALSEQKHLASVNFANILPYFATKRSVVFAATVQLPGINKYLDLLTSGFPLRENVKQELKTEASNRVKGLFLWPQTLKTEKLFPWMVTAETGTFMKEGGLAEVPVDLAESFNNRSKKDYSLGEMPVVTPLYLVDTEKKQARIEQGKDGKYKYTGALGKKIELEEVRTIEVPVYNETCRSMENEPVKVLVGKFDGTKYVFLKNDKYFDINPGQDNSPQKSGPYVTNTAGIGEIERFTFFSKAVSELMKKARQKDGITNVPAPNIIVANDWHVGAFSGINRYLAPVQKSRGKYDAETAGYLKQTPIVYIVHNAQYQGWSDDTDWEKGKRNRDNTDRIIQGLFETTSGDIALHVQDWKQQGDSPLHIRGTYNHGGVSLNLADRVVSVSSNYAEELTKSSGFGGDFVELFNRRKESGTLLGITNGYSKSKIAPSQAVIADINKAFGLEGANSFKVYEENSIEARQENKKVFGTLLNDLVQRKKVVKGVALYKPDECIKEIKNIENTPIITSVGRFADQKGFDILANALEKTLIQPTPPGKEKPLVVILGDGEDGKHLKNMKDKLLPEIASRLLLFEGFNKPLADTIQLCGDMFSISSKFEPCGLTQMEAMAKGNIPVATSTGGLVDTIDDGIDGFRTSVFYVAENGKNKQIYGDTNTRFKDNTEAFSEALGRGLAKFYNNPEGFKDMSRRAMQKDFSWDKQGGSLDAYIELFRTGKVPKIKEITA